MGAGQIGGIATLLDIDFHNAAGFIGEKIEATEGQFIVHFLSHAMMFCTGALIEAHVVLTAATCIFGERYKFEVFAGTHRFLEHTGISRMVHHLCLHKGAGKLPYNTGGTQVYGLYDGKNVNDVPPVTDAAVGDPLQDSRHCTAAVRSNAPCVGPKSTHVQCQQRYNYSSNKYEDCIPDNLALLVLSQQFQFHRKDIDADFVLKRIRYGAPAPKHATMYEDTSCRYYGWGSRRNGFLIPLLINIRRVNVVLLPREKCLQMFNYGDKFLCIQQHLCKSEKFGALCPDDVGTVIECSGFARGMMVSRLVDRPCGVGFLDLSKYSKFLMCGVDDSRDVVDHDPGMAMEFTSRAPAPTPDLITVEDVDRGDQQ